MLPVSPNEPKERTTGATDAQIEAAARRCWEAEMSHVASETWNSWRNYLIADLSNPASYIVPPGFVIAPAADVLTSEMRAAIGRLTEMTAAWTHLKSVQKKNARRGASQEACDEVNTAGYTWQRLYALITDDDVAVCRAIADGGAK